MVTTSPPTPVRPASKRVRLTSKPSRTRRRAKRDNLTGLLMSAPALCGLIAFVGVPFVVAIWLSLYNIHVNQPHPPKFWGLTQYRRLFLDSLTSGVFLRSLLNNFVFAVVVIPVQTGLALVFAVLLNRKLGGVKFFRALFFMPVVFPMALVAVIWRLILDRSPNGLLNASLHLVTGGLVPAHDWLGSSATALASVIMLSVWQGVGFQMIIILAALQAIPQERYEAAELDRANGWQQFIYITVPGIRNTLIFVVLYTTILAFRVYDQIYILIHSTDANQRAMQTILYQATSSVFDENNLGRAFAISVVLFVIVVAITLVQRALLRQGDES
jgi:multiple sugar transport system permease protein